MAVQRALEQKVDNTSPAQQYRTDIPPTPVKICYIGGGSVGWAHMLMSDLALCPELTGEVRLYDIDYKRVALNATFGNRLQEHPAVVSKFKYRPVRTLTAALKDVDFVFLSITPGSLDDMAKDIAIPARFGILHPVGDTVGPAGHMRALRCCRLYAGFARAVAEHAPKAWVINYTNPMTACTRTLTKVAPDLKAMGCCHEVFGTQNLLAQLVEKYLGAPKPHRTEIKTDVMGVNHFTWITRATWNGHDLLPIMRRHIEQKGVRRPYTKKEVLASDNVFHNARQITFELFARFGYLPAAGDRHLAEFVAGFLRDEDEVYRWGIALTPVAWRKKKVAERVREMMKRAAGKSEFQVKHSGEEGIDQMLALLGRRPLVTNVNVENQGQLPNLPLGAVVETNAAFGPDRVQPVMCGPVPAAILGPISRHVYNQELIVEAALEADEDKTFAAIANDPLVTIPIDDAWRMTQQMLAATRPWSYSTQAPR
jgi:galacturan 1,4-alpha-galacturonidase